MVAIYCCHQKGGGGGNSETLNGTGNKLALTYIAPSTAAKLLLFDHQTVAAVLGAIYGCFESTPNTLIAT